MDWVENALLFWKIVGETLVRVYGFEPEAADESVLAVRGTMTPRGIARNLTYHSQPLHVAANIAGVIKIKDSQLRAYKQILKENGKGFTLQPGVREAKNRNQGDRAA